LTFFLTYNLSFLLSLLLSLALSFFPCLSFFLLSFYIIYCYILYNLSLPFLFFIAAFSFINCCILCYYYQEHHKITDTKCFYFFTSNIISLSGDFVFIRKYSRIETKSPDKRNTLIDRKNNFANKTNTGKYMAHKIL